MPRYRIIPPGTELPPVLGAVGVAGAILGHTKTKSWADFTRLWAEKGEDALGGLELRDTEKTLLEKHSWAVSQCQPRPKVTILHCEKCQATCFTNTAKKAKCFMTLNCTGQMSPAVPCDVVEA